MDNLENKMRFPKLTELFKSHKEDFRILLATNTSSAKMQHIRKNPAVCVYYCERLQFRGVMLNGKVEIIKDAELKHALWHDYRTQYSSKGVNDPDYIVLSLYPIRAKGWLGSGKFEFTIT
jgi:general stress protein 26